MNESLRFSDKALQRANHALQEVEARRVHKRKEVNKSLRELRAHLHRLWADYRKARRGNVERLPIIRDLITRAELDISRVIELAKQGALFDSHARGNQSLRQDQVKPFKRQNPRGKSVFVKENNGL